ncbi:Uncharacterised protein [Raoultella planticola]|uniref:Uncharacterized protein n=1 Tax=Raoultella planticola TaxID=575 RepID=A0A485BEU5_RAOPL|nr:Uncharacterised protein [Raoultella planticola]
MFIGRIATWKGAIASGQIIPRVVMVLLNGSSHHAGYPDTVAAHSQHLVTAVLHPAPRAFIACEYLVPSWKM